MKPLTLHTYSFHRARLRDFSSFYLPLFRNRNLEISIAPLKSQSHQGTSLFTSAATNHLDLFSTYLLTVVDWPAGTLGKIPVGRTAGAGDIWAARTVSTLNKLTNLREACS